MYWVYILECSDGTYYTGQTKYLDRRMEQHASGKGAKYVKSRLPFDLKYTETYDTRGDAMRREIAIKKYPRSKKEDLINSAS